jgi:hypothetical protein
MDKGVAKRSLSSCQIQDLKQRTMNIHLNKPYKIIAFRQKRYAAHYNIPASDSLVVPVKNFQEEVQCDVRWENENGELKVLHEKMFVSENLIELNPLLDEKLFELWAHYYNGAALN